MFEQSALALQNGLNNSCRYVSKMSLGNIIVSNHRLRWVVDDKRLTAPLRLQCMNSLLVKSSVHLPWKPVLLHTKSRHFGARSFFVRGEAGEKEGVGAH